MIQNLVTQEQIEEVEETVENKTTFPNGIGFYPDVKDGKYGFNTDPNRGADTFYPFKSDTFKITFDLKRTVKTTGGQSGDDKTTTSSDTVTYELSSVDGNITLTPSKNSALTNSATTSTGRYGRSTVTTSITNAILEM